MNISLITLNVSRLSSSLKKTKTIRFFRLYYIYSKPILKVSMTENKKNGLANTSQMKTKGNWDWQHSEKDVFFILKPCSGWCCVPLKR